MLRIVLDTLSSDRFGGSFTKGNTKIAAATIDTYENEMLQVRPTNPRNGPPGVRVSILNGALGSLATEDGGFAKLQAHLDIRDALAEALPSGVDVTFTDKPNRKGQSYPNIYVNKAQATSAAVDTGALTTQAIDAGVDMQVLRECVSTSNWDRLRGEISLAAAGVPRDSETTPEAPADGVDEDGDSDFPA